MMTEKRFTTWGNRIKRNGKLLNINFETKTDAKLCCKLCNQMDKDNQEYIDELDEIFKWYKEYYGETILDTKMEWNDDNKISKLKKENEQLKKEIIAIEKRADKVYDENEQLKQSNKEAVDLISEAIVEALDGARYNVEDLLEKAIELLGGRDD